MLGLVATGLAVLSSIMVVSLFLLFSCGAELHTGIGTMCNGLLRSNCSSHTSSSSLLLFSESACLRWPACTNLCLFPGICTMEEFGPLMLAIVPEIQISLFACACKSYSYSPKTNHRFSQLGCCHLCGSCFSFAFVQCWLLRLASQEIALPWVIS